MKLYNFNTKLVEDISDDDVSDRLYTGDYGFLNDDTVTLDGPEGVRDYTGGEAAQLFGDGSYLFVPKESLQTREETAEISKQRAMAFGEGVLRGAGTELVAGGVRKLYEPDLELYEARKRLPEATAGAVTGGIGSLFLPVPTPGKAKVGKELLKYGTKIIPSRLLDDAGNALVKKFGPGLAKYLGVSTTKSITGKALKTGVAMGTRGAIDAAGYSTADVVADYVYTNKKLTVEDSVSRIVKSTVTSGVFASLLGGTASVSYNSAKKAGEKAFSSIFKASQKISKNKPKRNIVPEVDDIKQDVDIFDPSIGTTSAQFSDVPEENIIRYRDKSKIIDLDRSSVNKQITDLDNIEDLNKLGEKMNMPAIGHVIAGELREQTVIETLRRSVPFYSTTPKKQILNTLGRLKNLKHDHIFKRIEEVYKDRDDLLVFFKSGEPVTPHIQKRFKTVSKDLALYKRTLNGMKKGKTPKKSVVNAINAFNKDLKASAKKFSEVTKGYRDKDSIYIFDNNFIKENIKDAWYTSLKKGFHKDVKGGSVKFLNWLGARPGDLRVSSNRINEMGEYIEVNAVSKDGLGKWVPTYKKLNENLIDDANLSISEMDGALVRAGNYLAEKQLGTGLYGKNVSDYIKENWIAKYITKEGQILPIHQAKVTKLRKEAERWDSYKGEFTVDQIIELKRSIGKEVQEWFPSANPLQRNKFADEFGRSFSRFFDDSVMDQIRKNPLGGEEILSNYINGKKLYSTVTNVRELLDKAMEKAANKSGFDFPDWQKTAAMGIGGGATTYAIMGNPILGATIASTVPTLRWANNHFGEFWSGKFYDKLAKRTLTIEQYIDTSVNKFVTEPLMGPISLGIGLSANWKAKDAWEKESIELEKRSANIEGLNDKFREENTMAFDLYPDLLTSIVTQANEALNFLEKSFPKSPYPQNSGISWQPSADIMYSYERMKKAVIDPNSILDGIAMGYVADEEIKVLKGLYPAMLEKIKEKFLQRVGNKKLTYQQRVLAKRLFGFTGDNTLSKMPVMQQQIQGQPQEQVQQQPQQSGKIRQSRGKFSGQEPIESLRIENK